MIQQMPSGLSYQHSTTEGAAGSASMMIIHDGGAEAQ